jgi:hypothetical protein
MIKPLTLAIGAVALIVFVPLAAAAQVAAPPAAAGPAVGTIIGMVSTDAEGKQPVRRAVISIRGERSGEVITTTGQDGIFQQTELAPDRYTITASRPAYLVASYGAKQTGRAGVPLVLKAGETRTISLVMPRASAITGTVIGIDGLPAAGVTVTALQPGVVNGDRVLVGSAVAPGVQADDRGRYRIWGLRPGQYVIVAKPTAAVASMAVGDDPALRRNVTYAPVYFPGTSDIGAARPVRVGLGQEIAGIDVPIQLVPSAVISGVMQTEDSTPLPAGVRLLLLRMTTGLAPYDPGEVVTPAADGRFEWPALPPGRYIVRLLVPTLAPGASPAGPANSGFWARTEVELDGRDIKDLVVTLRRGFQIDGSVTFESRDGIAAPDPAALTIYLEAVTVNGIKPASPGAVKPNASGTFTVTGLAPGRYRVSPGFPPMSGRTLGWYLKSVSLGGAVLAGDVLDVPSSGITGALSLAMTTAPTRVTGQLLVPNGSPATEYFIVLFPTDETRWANQSRNIQNTRPGTDGTFTLTNASAGTYFLCALDDLLTSDLADPGFLRSLTSSAIKVIVQDEQTVTLTLQIGKH